jgi:hypothetical protein
MIGNCQRSKTAAESAGQDRSVRLSLSIFEFSHGFELGKFTTFWRDVEALSIVSAYHSLADTELL